MFAALIPLIESQMPAVIAGIQALFAKNNPGQPVPTDAEVMLVFRDTIAESLAKGEAWLAAHPAVKTD